MDQIVLALDILQETINIRMGYLLPTITIAKRQLRAMMGEVIIMQAVSSRIPVPVKYF